MAKAENQISILQLKKLKPENKGDRLADGGGLTGRVFAGDPVSVGFTYQYRSPETGKLREISCGSWPTDDLSAIRKLRDDYRLQVRKGADPIAQRQREQEAARLAIEAAARAKAIEAARLTYHQLWERYTEHRLASRRSNAEIQRRACKDVLPVIGSLYVGDVTRQHIAAIGLTIASRGGERSAHLTIGDVQACYRWALDAGLLGDEEYRFASVRRSSIGAVSGTRERTLSEPELRHLLQTALAASGLGQRQQLAFRAMLATGCRIGELCKARCADVDLDAMEWCIPAENSKNKGAHTVYLSAFAADALRELLKLAYGAEWLLPAVRTDGHASPVVLGKAYTDRQAMKPLQGRTKAAQSLVLDGGRWTPHDLRRTAQTMMRELGISKDVANLCLNHEKGSKVDRAYDHARLVDAQREAFRLLGERLALLANPEANNVVTLKLA